MAIPLAVVAIGKQCVGVLADSLKVALDPKSWPLLLICGLVGFYKGCTHDEERWDRAQAIALEQQRRTVEINRRNLNHQKEIGYASETERARLAGELAAINKRLRDNAGSGFLPKPSASPERPVPTGDHCVPAERTFLTRVYLGELLCYPRRTLDEGLRQSSERLLGQLEELAGEASDSLDDRRWWGIWAGKVGACPIPSVVPDNGGNLFRAP